MSDESPQSQIKKKSSYEKYFDYFINDYDLNIEEIYKSLTLLQENKEKIASSI